MEIKHEEHGNKGKFFIEINHKEQAQMTYKYIDDETINIDHTEVKEALKGQGIGYKLIDEAVVFMRKNKLKVAPTCSYAQAIFKKKEADYADVIA